MQFSDYKHLEFIEEIFNNQIVSKFNLVNLHNVVGKVYLADKNSLLNAFFS